MNWSEKMLDFRARHMLTQTQLANIIGAALITVHRIERGKSNPTQRNAVIFERKMKEWEEKKNVSVQ